MKKYQFMADDNKSWVQNVHDAQAELRSIAGRLSGLGSAFYATGNELMGQKLEALNDDICNASQIIGDQIGRNIQEQADEIQKAFSSNLEALLSTSGSSERES